MTKKSKFSLSSLFVGSRLDFMKPHKFTFVLSVALTLASIILIAFRGLNLGIDFSGGLLIEANFNSKVNVSKVRSILDNGDFGEVTIQNLDENNVMIRVSAGKKTDQNKIVEKIKETLGAEFSDIEYRKIDFVGPGVGNELIKKGFLAIFLSFAAIMIYIWIRFDWQFGLGAIIALIHDAIMTLGFFAATGLEFNLTSVASILTIIGYSINDSVVIYDRIRENIRRFKSMDLSQLINLSINSTLSRTILTAGTTLTSLVALILFGGDALKSFSLSLFFGIIIGTYSSIYISAPILIYIDPRNKKTR